MKEAPLHHDALRVARWVAENVPAGTPSALRVHAASLDLVEHVDLALHGLDRDEELTRADRAVARLRVQLRLQHELGALSAGGLLHVAELLDGIGRQIGGWQRRLAGG